VAPVVKGQYSSTVREWFRIALNMGAKEHLQILGIGADGDSKFRKFYLEEFLERSDGLNDVFFVSPTPRFQIFFSMTLLSSYVLVQ